MIKIKAPLKQIKNKAGFTLVEVIVVLVILAILIALIAPTLTGYIKRASAKAIIAECRQGVVATQTELSQAYATSPGDYSAGIPTAIKDAAQILSEVPGDIISAQANVSHMLLHLTYERDGKTVVYCRNYPCGEEGHLELYNIIGEEGGSEPDPGGPDPGGEYASITIGGVKFLANGELSDDTKTTPPGIFYYKGNYYYLAGDGQEMTPSVEEYLRNAPLNKAFMIDTENEIMEYTGSSAGSTFKPGAIYRDGEDYYMFKPDNPSLPTWEISISTDPSWFVKITTVK